MRGITPLTSPPFPTQAEGKGESVDHSYYLNGILNSSVDDQFCLFLLAPRNAWLPFPSACVGERGWGLGGLLSA